MKEEKDIAPMDFAENEQCMRWTINEMNNIFKGVLGTV